MSERKHIILIEPVGGHGGMDLYDYGLAIGLIHNGCMVDFFTCDDTKHIEHFGITKHNSFGKVWQTKNKIVKLIRFIRGYWRAFRFAKKRGAIAVHLHFFDLDRLNRFILFLGKIHALNVFVTLHDISSLSGKQKKNFLGVLETHAKGIIVHNEFSLNTLINQAPKLKHKTRVIPHGSYRDFVKEVEIIDVTSFSEKQPLKLLFFGQIKPTKGLPVLLKAIQILDKKNIPVHLMIAGKPWKMDERELEVLENMCRSCKQVYYEFDYINNEQVHHYFENTHVVVLPYQQIYQSGVLLLAMSYGRPVICSDLPAFKEIITDCRNGFLFNQGDFIDLSEKIQLLYEQPEMLKQAELNARETISTHFSWSGIAKKIVHFYCESQSK